MNRAPKHTKGPWKTGSCDSSIIWAERFNSTDWTECPGAGPESVAIGAAECPAWARVPCDGDVREAWISECRANARLMAAAPDLLDACKRATEILRGQGAPGWGVAKDILNSAIAKAEGRGNRADANSNPPTTLIGE